MSDRETDIFSVQGLEPDLNSRFVRRWQFRADCRSDAVVLCLHGIESHSGWFENFAVALAGKRIDCVAFDRPGNGSPAPQSDHNESIGAVETDLIKFYSRMRQQYKRVFIVGMSWGGLLAAYSLARRSINPDLLVLLVPGIFSNAALPAADILMAVVGTLRGKTVEVALPLRPQDFSDDAAIVAYIKNDRLRRTKASVQLLRATLTMQKFLQRADFGAGKPEFWLSETDRIIDRFATESYARSRGLLTHVFSNQGHCLILECPDRLATLMAERVGQYL